DAVRVLATVRAITHRKYKQLLGEAAELQQRLEELGIATPLLEDGTDVFEALKQMGDRRGHYMPRIRKSGKYLLIATKAGVNPRLETFDTRIGRRIRGATLKRDGYKLTYQINKTPSEAAFLDANLVAMNDVVSNAMQRLEQEAPTLESFDMRNQRVTYKRKTDGENEEHLVIIGPKRGTWTSLFEDFGGGFWDDEQNGLGEVWHFINAQPGTEAQIAKAMAAQKYGAVELTEAFARIFTQQVAAIIHSRGSRSRKIGRNEATGENVFLGFEEDALKAVTMAGKATAGGTAKRLMARDMMQIITGTDIDWKEFKNNFESDSLAEDDDVNIAAEAWAAYQEQVNERRIDSATQPIAYKEGMSFMREMLRNEEPSERVFGTFKGIAGVKYLSGIAPGLVNMTALATTVPAAMKTYGNIPLRRTGGLLARGVKNYVNHYMHSRWGKGTAATGEDAWLFEQISRRGWDEAQKMMEAVGVLQNGMQRRWSRFVDLGLIVFSTTERINRGATLAAAYYGLREQGMGQEEALTQAKEISDKGHGVYGKENLPVMARGSSVGSQVARSFYMYKTFSHNYLQVLGEMMGKKDAAAAMYMILSTGVLAGGGAMVVTPIAAALLKAAAAVIPGMEPPDDPEEWVYRWVEKEMGAPAGRFARQGAAGLAGVNLKGSLSIGVMDLPTSIKDVLGAPYSLFEDLAYGVGDVLRGDVAKGAERIAPRVLAAPMRAVRESTEGVTSHSNQPLYYGNEKLRANWYEALLRSLSFNPAGISEKREKQWKERMVEKDYTGVRTDIYARMRRFVLSGGSKADWADILIDVERYNARVRSSSFESVPFITERVIKSQLKKMATPARREKIRAGTAEREDPGRVEFDPGTLQNPRRSNSSRRSRAG
ncbi:MAG: PLxRFG domain-containing protein, partial [Verrucomicrobia bacterium]|nr:PLxRFG domain-containing protein [Verrucomicrobiota bacterium]